MLTALRMRSEEKRTPNSACEDSSVLSQTLSRSLPWVHDGQWLSGNGAELSGAERGFFCDEHRSFSTIMGK